MSPSRHQARAWRVVAGVAVVQAVAAGVGFYGSTIYVAALTEGSASFSIVAVSVATGGFMLVSGLGGVVVARALDRWGPRRVLAAGALVQASALFALGRVVNDTGLLLAYAAMGLGFAALTVIPAGRLVAAWFDGPRRAVAMSFAFMGLPIGGVVGTPVVSHLVESVGFRDATSWLALALVVVVVPTASALREPAGPPRRPDAVATAPLASTPGAVAPVAAAPPSGVRVTSAWTARDAVRSQWFVLVTAATSLAMVSQVGALTHLYTAVTQVRDPATAATTVSTVTFASLIGRLAGSWALSRFGLLRSTCTLAATQSVALLGIVAWRDAAVLPVAAVVLGLTVGNLQVSQPLLLADRFGPAEFAQILAVGNLFSTVGMAAGPLVVGVGVAGGQSYGPALTALAACSLVAAALLLLAGSLDRRRRHAAAQIGGAT